MSRQLWLQRQQAVQMINAYAEAMNGGKGSTPPAQGARMSSDQLFAEMGLDVT